MTRPRLLRRADPVEVRRLRRPDPVVTLTAVLLAIVCVGLLVVALEVVTSYNIVNSHPAAAQAPLTFYGGDAHLDDVVLGVEVTVGAALLALLLNVGAATVRHVRTGRRA